MKTFCATTANSPPSTDDKNLKALPQKDRLVVTRLSVVLQLAASLDVSHIQNVTDVILQETKSGWRLNLSGPRDQMLITWALNHRKSQFRDVFGVDFKWTD